MDEIIHITGADEEYVTDVFLYPCKKATSPAVGNLAAAITPHLRKVFRNIEKIENHLSGIHINPYSIHESVTDWEADIRIAIFAIADIIGIDQNGITLIKRARFGDYIDWPWKQEEEQS